MTGVTFHKCSSLEGKSKKNFFLLMTEFNFFFFFFFFFEEGAEREKGSKRRGVDAVLLDPLFQAQCVSRRQVVRPYIFILIWIRAIHLQ